MVNTHLQFLKNKINTLGMLAIQASTIDDQQACKTAVEAQTQAIRELLEIINT